jgi:hypothetical protein
MGWKRAVSPLPSTAAARLTHIACSAKGVSLGTWGPANFADDAALDWLGSLVDELVAEIDKGIRSSGPGDLCQHWPAAKLEVLAVLCEQLPAIPPHPDQVASWREIFLRAWDEEIDDLDPKPDYKAERRRVLEATFERVTAAADRWHKKTQTDPTD